MFALIQSHAQQQMVCGRIWDLPCASTAEILLMNATGQICRRYSVHLEAGSTNLDISGLSAGLYTVRAKSPTFERQIGKLVILPR